MNGPVLCHGTNGITIFTTTEYKTRFYKEAAATYNQGKKWVYASDPAESN